MNIKQFFIEFGNKFLFYIFITDFIVASWNWVNSDPSLDLMVKIFVFLTVLPAIFLPSLAKLILRGSQEREESIRLFDVIYGVFVWALSLILSFSEFNLVSLITILLILYVIYNIITLIGWRYRPRLLLTLVWPFIIINIMVVFYVSRFTSVGIEYYSTINPFEFAAGITVLAIIGFLFIYNEISEILLIFGRLIEKTT
ncbi:MAG: hypothetical protein EU539_04280 [Promethearchaeota archaeon]|nr:MAG: hypothetical protein EU539_04280 [Candidatus Lokiarchaeota archaeon]